jgi:hypothetical protein
MVTKMDFLSNFLLKLVFYYKNNVKKGAAYGGRAPFENYAAF